MSGLGIPLYTDEDISPVLAEQLQRSSYDVLSCRAAGNSNRALSDEWQLAFAVSQERTLFSRNAKHYLAIDRRWRDIGREHHGILLVARPIGIGVLIQRIAAHLDTYSPEQQHNTVLYLAS